MPLFLNHLLFMKKNGKGICSFYFKIKVTIQEGLFFLKLHILKKS